MFAAALMSSGVSSIDSNLHRAIDLDQLVVFQAEALREILTNPHKSSKLDPLETIAAIIESVKKIAELLEISRRELKSL
jgi:hypothetical protein